MERVSFFGQHAQRYEIDHPLLAVAARNRLRQCRHERDQEMMQCVAAAALLSDATQQRQLVLDFATGAVQTGVREFADGLLLSQGRLGTNADLLREYTSLLANEIVETICLLRLFRDTLPPAWQEDPITDSAARCCEDAIHARAQIGDYWPFRQHYSGDNPTWCPAVKQWEAYKAANLIGPSVRERIPEDVFRLIVSRLRATAPPDVHWTQILEVGTDFCRHYGRVLLVPTESQPHEATTTGYRATKPVRFWDRSRGRVPQARRQGECT